MRRECPQPLADIGLDTQERRLDLAELARVDVDVQDLGVRTERLGLAGGAVVEADAESDQEIALFEQQVRVARGMHADHADKERVVRRASPQVRAAWQRPVSTLFRRAAQQSRGVLQR